MRPLQAHCHRGLGMLYARLAQWEQARAELSAAIEMYRDMEMSFWVPETEAALVSGGGSMMDFYEILDQVIDILKQRDRVTYRALKRQFNIDDEFIEDVKAELIQAQRLAIDEDGAVLIWTGEKESSSEPIPELPTLEPTSLPTQEPEREPLSYTPPHLAEKILTSRSALEGERKQVSVFFCDLQNSTPMAEKIGPENMHALLNRFFEIALSEVHRYEGTINQFLGDGFMALFGAPIAHEDHARRAVLAALGLQRRLKGRLWVSPME